VTQGPVVLTADRPTSGDRSAPCDAFRSCGACLLHRPSVSDLSRRHPVTTRLRLALARLLRAIEARSAAPSRERTAFPSPGYLRPTRTPSSGAFPIRGLGRPLPFSMSFGPGSLPDPSRLAPRVVFTVTRIQRPTPLADLCSFSHVPWTQPRAAIRMIEPSARPARCACAHRPGAPLPRFGVAAGSPVTNSPACPRRRSVLRVAEKRHVSSGSTEPPYERAPRRERPGTETGTFDRQKRKGSDVSFRHPPFRP
jgi:hypothetical protein